MQWLSSRTLCRPLAHGDDWHDKNSDAVKDGMHGDTGPEILGERKEQRNNECADKNRDEVSEPPAQMTQRERSDGEDAG
jgi:hypothetical protein